MPDRFTQQMAFHAVRNTAALIRARPLAEGRGLIESRRHRLRRWFRERGFRSAYIGGSAVSVGSQRKIDHARSLAAITSAVGGPSYPNGCHVCEIVVYNQESGQLLTGSLMDYAAPRDALAPPFRTEMDQSTPCKTDPLGVKGVGELGTTGATPCVVNAVSDELARNGLAKRAPMLQMPLTAPRVWEMLQPNG